MARIEEGIEDYVTSSGMRRYKVRWWEDGSHRAQSFDRLNGPDGARAHRDKVRQLRQSGKRVVSSSSTNLTLNEFAIHTWRPLRKKQVEPITWNIYSHAYNSLVLDEPLGDMAIANIDAEDLVEWHDWMRKKGVGADLQHKAINVLNMIFKEAGRRTRTTGVTINPVVMLEKPKLEGRREARVWGPVVVESVRFQLLTRSKRRGKKAFDDQLRLQDATLVSIMYMAGLRPGEALALRWRDIEGDVLKIRSAMSENEIVGRTKTRKRRDVPIIAPLKQDLAALRELKEADADDFLFLAWHRKTNSVDHFSPNDWKQWRERQFDSALQRVESGWREWRKGLSRSQLEEDVRESITGLEGTRPYDLGRHTHSSLNLAAGVTPQRLARIQGHSLRTLSEVYGNMIEDFEDSEERIDLVGRIRKARKLVWGDLSPSTGK